jgi:site-specific recombinase XerD
VLDMLISSYLVFHQTEGRSPRTIEWHQTSLSAFRDWLTENGLTEDPQHWNINLLRSYVRYLQTRPNKNTGGLLSPQSVASHVTSIKAFCHWLAIEEITSKDVAEKLSKPKVPKVVIQPLSTKEVERLVITSRQYRRTVLRDLALLYFMLDTGARASEVVNTKLIDIDFIQQTAKLFGKGSKERIVPLSPTSIRAIQKYALKGRHQSNPYLFQTEEGNKLQPSGLAWALKRMAVRAKVNDLHPHRLRHTFAISYLRAGGNVLSLQRIMGHSTLTVTQGYVAMVTDDLVREHKQHSPVEALKPRH